MRSLAIMAALVGFTAAQEAAQIDCAGEICNPDEAGCMNWDAYFYASGGSCDDVWMEWDQHCMYTDDDTCYAIEAAMAGVEATALQQVLKRNMADKKDPAKKLALLGATEEVEATQEADNHSGLIIGASATVIGAAAAILALRKCSKKSENDSFERA